MHYETLNFRISIILDELKVVFYGLSSDGIRLAEKFVEGNDVTLIDENLRLAIPFRGKGFAQYGVFERDLLPLTSFSDSLASANVIFFSPKVRKVGVEGRGELLMWLKELGRHMSQGVTIVYLLPLAPRKAQEVIAIIEDQSGLKEGREFNFLYSPLTPEGGLQGFVGSSQSPLPNEVNELLGRPEVIPFHLAELRHFKNILPALLQRALKLIFQEPDGDLYISEAVKGMLDAHLLASSAPTSSPSFHMASSIIKGVDYYIKVLEDYLKQLVKRMGLKAIRTRVLLLWDNDLYELRGDEYRVKAALQLRLQEAFGDVEVPPAAASPSQIFASVERSNLILVCTRGDEEEVRRLRRAKGVVRATIPPSPLNL